MEYQNNYQIAIAVRESGPKLLSTSYAPCIFCGHRYPLFKGIKVVGGYSLDTGEGGTPPDAGQLFICDRCIIAKALLSLSYLVTDDFVGKGLTEAATKILDHQKAMLDDKS